MEKIQLNIGGYQILSIPTGLFALDGGAMFGTVPKTLWQKSNPADEHNRIPMEARALLLKSKDRNILIDTGNGSDFIAKYGAKLGGKFAEIYAIEHESKTSKDFSHQKTQLEKSLNNYDLEMSDITDVILTHLHFDHAGGATKEINGKILPAFPKAQYHLQKNNLLTAKNPNSREKASYLSANFEPLIEAQVLNLIEGGQENYFPNVALKVSNGHTLGQQIVIVEDENQSLVYCADLIPTSSHVRSAWIMGYDLDPLKIIEEKRNLLSHLLTKKQNDSSYLFFEHDPYCDLATFEMINEDFHVKRKFIL
jgi:glyoxylase-like metal-dependent hydrolase (beta-lactamase superfamily II)